MKSTRAFGPIDAWCIGPGVVRLHAASMIKPLTLIPPSAPRISSRLRQAIELHVREGRSITEACAAAGVSRQGFHKAMKRHAVRDLLEDEQRRFVLESEARRTLYKARALEVALDLMLNAKSEAVRARMAEFLAADGKVSPVSVHIDARQGSGYEYVPPGQKLVEIEEGPEALVTAAVTKDARDRSEAEHRAERRPIQPASTRLSTSGREERQKGPDAAISGPTWLSGHAGNRGKPS